MDVSEPAEQSLTALVVEDDPSLRPYISRVLQQEGFLVLTACGGAEGLAIFGQHPVPVDLLVTDVHLGEGPNGVEVAEQLLEDRNDLAVLVLSGTPEGERLATGKGLPFLAKPFPLAALTERVREVLADKLPSLRGPAAGGDG